MISFNINDIKDPVVQENFRKLEDLLRAFPLFTANFQFVEITVTSAVTNKRVGHGLGFIPKDVIQTFQTSGVTVTWNTTGADKNAILISTTGPCTVRAFIGKYPN